MPGGGSPRRRARPAGSGGSAHRLRSGESAASFRCVRLQRQADAKDGAAGGTRKGLNSSSMRLYDGAADGKPESDAAGVAGRVAGVGAIEFLENSFFLAGRNAGAAVANFDGHRAILLGAGP